MQVNVFLHQLEESKIPFVLLRPVHCVDSNDIDLWVKESDFSPLVAFLISISHEIYWRKTNARESVQIVINNTLTLDIQFTLSFLPYKLFQINKEINIEVSQLIYESDYVLPNLKRTTLFCLWANRILLDKKRISSYTSLPYFKQLYQAEIEHMLASEQFCEFTSYLFGARHKKEVDQDLRAIVAGEDKEVQQKYAKLLYREHKSLYLIKAIFETKFKIERRLGVFNKKRNINLLHA